MRRYGARTCNFCKFHLKPHGQSRFVTKIYDRYYAVAQLDQGIDESITFKTRKGKVMDFCGKRCRHMFYYGRLVPINCSNPGQVHNDIIRARLAQKKIRNKSGFVKLVRWVLGLE